MNLTEAKAQFIQRWGVLGSQWGINRTMAQMHALLLVAPEPMTTEDIMQQLSISRGNTNMNVRDLINWNLVNKVIIPGERKEYFVAGKNKVEGKLFGARYNRETDINYSDVNPTTGQEQNEGYGKLKRLDYGFNVMTGLDLGKFMVGANYGYGLAKINSGTSNRADDNNKHRVLSFSLGVRL